MKRGWPSIFLQSLSVSASEIPVLGFKKKRSIGPLGNGVTCDVALRQQV